jgi:hypothetical protein
MLTQAQIMNKRPLSVTIIAWLFITAGVVGFAYHLSEFKAPPPFQFDVALVCLVRLLAIVGGAFMLRGQNWARWLSIVWIAGHAVLSAFHPLSELIMHSVLLVVFTFFLFRPRASAYFRRGKVGSTQNQETLERSNP